MRSTRRWAWLIAATVVMAEPGAVQAQSLFGGGGLGIPVEALDARARGLGGVGPGLFGATLTQSDPAGLAGVQLPMITVTMQPTWGEFDSDVSSGDLKGTRFPMLGVAYPFGTAGVFSVSYGGFLDQRWAAERPGSFLIGGETVPGTDRFESEGGISQFHLGWARRVGDRVGVGVGVGRFTGRVDRSFTRTFDTTAVSDVAPFQDNEAWSYGGSHVTFGATFDPVSQVRIAGSFGWAGTLEATPTDGTGGETLEFDLPNEIRVGASGALTNRLMATVGVRLADWSGVDPVFDTTSAQGQTLTFGAGVEWGGPRFIGRTLPVRLGYRRAELPFSEEGGSDPLETSLSLGIGFNIAQVDEFPLAALDFTMERGNRTGGVLEERFWRGTLTLKVSGR